MSHVITINETHWPAFEQGGCMVVDLRMFGPGDELGYWPDKLSAAGVPEGLIEAAQMSQPQGFAPLVDR